MPAAVSSRLPDPEPWKALRLFSLYRIGIASLFLVVYLTGAGPTLLGRLHPGLFLWTTVFYLAVALISSIGARRHWPDFALQVYLQTGLDIGAILLLMHASGGVTSGLGMLLIATVGGVSLLQPGRTAIAVAAIGAIALLLVESYGNLRELYEQTAYTQTGILGALLFITALIASTLARRTRQSEELATRRSVDLANLSELNEHIIERMRSGIIVADDDGRIRLMNEAAWAMLGEPQVERPFQLQSLCPPLYDMARSWREEQRPAPLTLSRAAGVPQDLQARFTRLGGSGQLATLIFLEDQAELGKQAQDMKLASLGRLTASIAHEIRNPLGAISHAAQLVAESESVPKEDQRLIEIIQSHSRRVNEVVRNVLQLSRRENSNPETIDLESWLDGFIQEFGQYEHLSPEQIHIEKSQTEHRVVFDPSQLHQVLWNLCSNAAKYGRGSDESLAIALHVGGPPGSDAPFVEVVDQGPGIETRDVDRLFEPFYTTGQGGTGLGLYIARQLCENNGASLTYLPVPTGGSCFRIEFRPAAPSTDVA